VTQQVVAAAIVRAGRVLAARRAGPPEVAGGWELPGGKVEPTETAAAAVVREVREELGCDVRVDGQLGGQAAVRPGYDLTVHLASLVAGEPVPHEHGALRWLAPEELDEVAWLPADRPFLPALREILLNGQRLVGGNVGGAVRIGSTVRRGVGAWTPAVHALLAHLARRGFTDVPAVLGTDERGREVLTYLPGRVPEVDVEVTSEAALTSAMRWLRRYHDAVDGFHLDGPWRTTDRRLAPGELVCHCDFAPYNVALADGPTGEVVVGVFDWDMASPGTRLEDLAFAAWNWVPLHGSLPPDEAAHRLELMAVAYGRGVAAADVAGGVVPRIERSLDVITRGQVAGDPGMLNLGEVGEPERTARALADLRRSLPAVTAALPRRRP
jgi:8-oxo-dGTP diphosphatase